ncbi:MAG: hypothetical protein WC683_19280 [bacterium]
MPRKVYVPTTTFFAEGFPGVFSEGVTRVFEGDPVLKGREHIFKLVEVEYPDVEDASAEPGVPRGVPKPAPVFEDASATPGVPRRKPPKRK